MARANILKDSLDVHFIPWHSFQDLQLSSLYVETEVVDNRVAQGEKDGVERKTGHRDNIFHLEKRFTLFDFTFRC